MQELTIVSDVINSNKEIYEFLKAPIVKKEEKLKVLLDALNGKVSETVVNLLKIMAQKDRLALLPQLTIELKKEIQAQEKKYNGIVESNETIENELIAKLEKKLSAYSGADVTLFFIKSDIDGIKVSVDDLGLELNFSKRSVKEALLENILKAL
jgi:F-type H+-transporting ATPase subunit delta